MKRSLMQKNNWIIVLAGVAIFYLGYFLISKVTRNYDSFYAFVSILTTVIGLIVVTVGLSMSFNKETEEKAEKQ